MLLTEFVEKHRNLIAKNKMLNEVENFPSAVFLI